MVIFKKENGFPVNLTIETEDYEDKKEGFKGYISKFYIHKGTRKKLIKEFYHKDYRDRIHFADGFFTALRLNKK